MDYDTISVSVDGAVGTLLTRWLRPAATPSHARRPAAIWSRWAADTGPAQALASMSSQRASTSSWVVQVEPTEIRRNRRPSTSEEVT